MRKTELDWLLEAVALVALGWMSAIYAIDWNELPERVPTHFDINGATDAWGKRNSLLILPMVALGVCGVMTAVLRMPASMMNLPAGVDRKDPEVRAEVQRMLRWVRAVVAVGLSFLGYEMIQAALGERQGIPAAGVALLPIGTLLVVGYYMRRVLRLRKPMSEA